MTVLLPSSAFQSVISITANKRLETCYTTGVKDFSIPKDNSKYFPY
jgi:hypothetical protein